MKVNKRFKYEINHKRDDLVHTYINKYFNMFMHMFKWTGLEPIQADYIMRKFWDTGTVAAYKEKHTDEIAFTQWALQKYNMYDFPEVVMLINKWNVPNMPKTPQTVDEDVVLGWIQANHKPIKEIVTSYINRLVDVDMVINTNLITHKLPFLIGVSPEDKDKAEAVTTEILNDEPVIFMDANDVNMINNVTSATPYIIDKLYSYRTSLENELLTYLGIDNAMLPSNSDRLLVDQVNANNQAINTNQQSLLDNLNAFCDKISEVLGITISVEPTVRMNDMDDQLNNEIKGSTWQVGGTYAEGNNNENK